MKMITVRQPHASYIVEAHPDHGFKNVENRTWRTHYRGPLLIHAGQSRDYDPSPDHLRSRVSMARGAIVGLVQLIDILQPNPEVPLHSAWSIPDNYQWVLADPIMFEEPVPFSGKLGLQEMNVSESSRLLEQLAKVSRS